MTPEAPGGRRTLSIASGTIASRVMGLVRILVLAYVLGFSPLADAFNLANTVPNMLYDLVLGGVASATFIPVFVERFALDGERRAWRSISSVVTAALIVLAASSVLAWVLAPYIIDGFTALSHGAGTTASAANAERSVATTLLRWFVPQVFCYGVVAIFGSLLNVRNRFAGPAWAPIANNLVCVGALVWFHLVDPSPTITTVANGSSLVWLAGVTTLGVAIQAAVLVPSLLRAGLGHLSFRVRWRDPAIKRVARLGAWTLGLVVANQASLYVVLALAFAIGGNGPISAYTYGWSFMQMPYAVVVVSVLAALTPHLAGLSTSGELEELGRRLSIGLRQSLVVIVPVAAVLIILAQPIVAVLLNHAHGTHALLAGTVLAVLAAGLPGFTVFQVAIRGLQSMQHARDTFWLYAVQNGATIALALVIGRHSLGALTASVSIAYGAAAVLALAVLAARGVKIYPAVYCAPVLRAVAAALVAAVAMAVVYNLPTATSGAGLLARLAAAAVCGVVVYGGLLAVSHQRASRARVR